MMTRREALGEMLNGHKIIHPDVDGIFEYSDGEFFRQTGFIRHMPEDSYGEAIIKATMSMDDGYERYVEPKKKKVKMWQWVIKGDRPYDYFTLTKGFYASSVDVSNACSGAIVKCADWTEIEVEVDDV